ncbi:WD40 repeat-like protein [Aspergillus sclerotioniger CBS 115572]|uniref:WD40 repeat-like protein n=1 Tax=Aspergillus sclerotioniger CBS 115572 TaxID=1450535 RepID=A0A317VFE4_9EURO|nr:WD40 repeat-like protein [Aspergillus sclerotioniger CBS 115572]PWY73106.1 WD40 repeat-like protein [Aspergillus sclerotioniger CBS 115572]
MASTDRNEDSCPFEQPKNFAPGHPKHWGQERAKIELDGQPTAVAVSPDRRIIAVGIGGMIYIFDADTQECLHKLWGHKTVVRVLKFAPLLPARGWETGVTYVLVSHGDCLCRIHENLSMSMEESKIVHNPYGLQTHQDVVVWQLWTKRSYESMSPDARSLAIQALEPIVSDLETKFGWEEPGKIIRDLYLDVKDAFIKAIRRQGTENKFFISSKQRSEGELAFLDGFSFTPDGKSLLYLEKYNGHDYLRFTELYKGHAALPNTVFNRENIGWFGMSPNGDIAATSRDRRVVQVWDERYYDLPYRKLSLLGDRGTCGAFSPNSRFLAVHEESQMTQIRIYDIYEKRHICGTKVYEKLAPSLAWTADGKYIAGGADNAVVYLWSAVTREAQRTWSLQEEDMKLSPVTRVQLVKHGKKLIFQTEDGSVVAYDFERKLKQLFIKDYNQPEGPPIAPMAVSNDSQLLVVPGDGVLRLWDL